ncbi:MAG: phosphate signaling complex protein PhoU [Coriobacteriales bacterium]|jgi:phosphate transport system protein|nr:phosphate signaling complex protein PhoU [Coriobacteriales bacterium]
MTREFFDEQLAQLDTELLKMGALVEQSLAGAMRVLETGEVQLAHRIIEADNEIDQKERDIETLCLHLLLRQQPVARDLRTISAALKMITDIERIGDQAADICKIVLDMEQAAAEPLIRVRHLPALGVAASAQVSAAIDAFVTHDLERAQQVILDDDTVDSLFTVVRGELFGWMRAMDEEQAIAIDLLLIAKYFERIGDHAQSVAEWVEYSITGMHKGVPIT